MSTPNRLSLSLNVAMVWLPVEAFAQDGDANAIQNVTGNLITRLGYNGNYDAEAPLEETDDVFLQVIASPVLHFSGRFRIRNETRIETVSPPTANRAFDDEGLFVRILRAEFSVTDRLSFHAGKMTPSFALASFVTPGMFGNSYNKEIELIDRVGIGGAYVFGGGANGEHTLTFNSFYKDTSSLSDSFGTSRGRTTLEDGGASNTEGLDSFTLSLEGRGIERFPGLTYKLGLIHQSRGVDGVADENGVSFSLVQTRDTARGDLWTFIGELAAFNNFEGTEDSIVYASAGVVYQTGPWTAVLSGTYRPRDLASGGSFDDYSLQTSVEYNFGRGVSLAFAHEFSRDENLDDKQLGIRLIKTIDFGG